MVSGYLKWPLLIEYSSRLPENIDTEIGIAGVLTDTFWEDMEPATPFGEVRKFFTQVSRCQTCVNSPTPFRWGADLTG